MKDINDTSWRQQQEQEEEQQQQANALADLNKSLDDVYAMAAQIKERVVTLSVLLKDTYGLDIKY